MGACSWDFSTSGADACWLHAWTAQNKQIAITNGDFSFWIFGLMGLIFLGLIKGGNECVAYQKGGGARRGLIVAIALAHRPADFFAELDLNEG